MNEGDKCICQENDWWNAYGEKSTMLSRGMRLTVARRRVINGLLFYHFQETPGDNCFLASGFKPLRALN
jgi:hypothetical protein